MRRRRAWWLVYGVCSACVLAGLAWITVLVLALERAELQATAQADHQERLRLALWRMDSWLAPRLASEAARPYFDYEPFYPQQRAYMSGLLYEIEPGEVLTPSPLLAFRSEYFRLHFQVEPDGSVTSPQAPRGNERELVEASFLDEAALSANQAMLDTVALTLGSEKVVACVQGIEQGSLPAPDVQAQQAQGPPLQRGQVEQQARNAQELNRRADTYQQSLQWASSSQRDAPAAKGRGDDGLIDEGPDPAPVSVDSLVPFWTGGSANDGAGDLVFVRRVRINGQTYFQGFLCDWTALRGALLEQIADLFGGAMLEPAGAPAVAELAGMMLATIPVELSVDAPHPAPAAWASTARTTLGITWLAVLAAIVAVGVTLQASIAFGAKRSRFASAVTHELRTPLTTFRMYTEMLAEGMVPGEEQRQTYLETLRDESGRLSVLVENVLSYARLEEGRHASHVRSMPTGDLLDQIAPALGRRATASGISLRTRRDLPADATVRTDADAVGQILFNLVDNACKYADASDDRAIDLRFSIAEGSLRIDVQDHGPGISPSDARAIFSPFERGSNEQCDAPGIGLGLALSRGLAADLGGTLALVAGDATGACFRLSLPL